MSKGRGKQRLQADNDSLLGDGDVIHITSPTLTEDAPEMVDGSQDAQSSGILPTSPRDLHSQGAATAVPKQNTRTKHHKPDTAGTSTLPKANHFRFGSEEPHVNTDIAAGGRSPVRNLSATFAEASADSDAEDEAPEVVTVSAAAETVRAQAMDAEKAAAR